MNDLEALTRARTVRQELRRCDTLGIVMAHVIYGLVVGLVYSLLV